MNKKNNKILIIEDSEKWMKLLCESLKSIPNLKIEALKSFEKAGRKIMDKKNNYDIIITDIYPTKESKNKKGLEIVEFINKTNNTPIIIVTGYLNSIVNSLNKYKTVKIFDKGDFDEIEFVNCVNKLHQEKKENDIENIIPNKIMNRIRKYKNELKSEINKKIIIEKENEIKMTRILNILDKLRGSNRIVQEYLEELEKAIKEKNTKIVENKLKISLMLIPAILGFESKIDLDMLNKKITNKTDEITFNAYKKLAKIYLSIIRKNNNNKR
jgi:ActR/RegA family two-component response regulator